MLQCYAVVRIVTRITVTEPSRTSVLLGLMTANRANWIHEERKEITERNEETKKEETKKEKEQKE